MKKLLLLILLFSACTQGKRNEQFQQGLQFTDNFEDGILHNTDDGGWWNDLGWGISEVVTDPTDAGNYVYRSYVPIGSPIGTAFPSNSEARAQMNYNSNSEQEMPMKLPWFSDIGVSFRFYIPDNWKWGPYGGIFWQLHETNTEYHTGPPPFYFQMVEGTLRVVNKTSSSRTDPIKSTWYHNQYTFTKNHWYYFVVNGHLDYRKNGNGFFKVYMKQDSLPDGDDLLVDYVGATGFNAENGLTMHLNIGKYMASMQYQDRVDEMIDLGITYYEYFYDDIVYQDSHIDLDGHEPGNIHNNTLQSLLNNNSGGVAQLIDGDTYIEDSQITIPPNTTLNGNGAILKAHSSFYQDTYSGTYDLHKFLLLMKDGSEFKDFTIDGDNKQLWGGIVVEGDNCTVKDVDVTGTWFSGVWFEGCSNSTILRGTMTDAANVPGNWATGMVEMRDVNNIMIDGVTFIDTKSIGCGGVKAKPKSVQGVRIITDVTIQNCTFDLFKWHGWLNEGDKVIGNYAIELSKNDMENVQILNNSMNTTISTAGDYNHAEDYNYGKLIIKGNHIYPEHQSSNILETSLSGVVFEDNYVEGGGFVISSFLNWANPGLVDPYFNIRINNNIFYFPNTRPTTLLRLSKEYSNIEIKNNTIYGPTGMREVLNFTDGAGDNITLHKNTITCFGSNTALKAGTKYTNLSTNDNKWFGDFSGVSENINDFPFKNSGAKPYPFFTSTIEGYGANEFGEVPPIDPPTQDTILIIGDNIQLIYK